ncbi:MAG: acetyl-CoA carboxylase biotin carboxyl carrier protein subunit [Deltaproteobacteria bacterium]|nr:acetyl-CoA carboxylase biotin carboxyl carrier protein subunit [Deltaproteobacteria bacterium]
MKYRLKISEETADLDVSGSAGKQNAEFTIGEKAYSVRYRAIPGNCLHMIVDEKPEEAFVANTMQGKYVFVNGRSFLVQDADQLLSHRARRGGPDQTPGDVTPPMPAVVVRIMVEEGDLVKKGQGLIVVTAMKMETTLVAPSDGRVKKINTSVDAKVAPGEILVEIEKEERENE